MFNIGYSFLPIRKILQTNTRWKALDEISQSYIERNEVSKLAILPCKWLDFAM